MKIMKTPQSKICTIDRQMAKTYDVPIPAMYYGHMVLFLEWVPQQLDVLRIVTVDPQIPNFLSSMYSQFTHTANLGRRFKRGMERVPSDLHLEEEPEDESPAPSAQLF